MKNFEEGLAFVAFVGLLAVGGCGSSDEDPATSLPTAPESTETVDTSTQDAEPAEPDEPADAGAEPADPVGTVTVAGTTYEVEGRSIGLVDGEFVTLDGDFGICEANNPAFPGDANIQVKVGELGDFGFSISDDVAEADLGEPGLQEDASSVDYERTGDTIVGTAEFADAGSVEFDLTCK
ncbi:hypothetical protein [Demequina sp.]|uniref:hypothetical protein n=1 Tax=Demequina sp. TaxID=2050685 RepID=UPI0025C38386|nr:hypothetical protein [Demequina sp.]